MAEQGNPAKAEPYNEKEKLEAFIKEAEGSPTEQVEEPTQSTPPDKTEGQKQVESSDKAPENQEKQSEQEPTQEQQDEAQKQMEELEVDPKFYVKDKDGNVDWVRTAQKVYKSFVHANKALGRKGQELGDLRKEREQLLAEFKNLQQMKQEENPKLQDITDEQIIEMLDKSPKEFLNFITNYVKQQERQEKMKEYELIQKDAQLFEKEVSDFFAKNPEASEYEEKMLELYGKLPREVKLQSVQNAHLLLQNLYLQAKLENINSATAYNPNPPKKESGGIAPSNVQVKTRLTRDEADAYKAYKSVVGGSLTEEQFKQLFNKK